MQTLLNGIKRLWNTHFRQLHRYHLLRQKGVVLSDTKLEMTLAEKYRREKIRLVVLISSLTIGGAEQLLLELLKNMDRNRFSIKIIFLRSPGLMGKEFLKLGFEVKTDILYARFDLLGVFRLARILAAERNEILFLINHLNTLFYGVLAAKLAKVPVCVNWENETFKRYPFHKLIMFGRWIMHWGIDKVVAAAHGHKAYIRDVENIPYRKIISIYNGVDPERFSSSLTPQEAKERLRIPPHGLVVSIIAVLRPDKAHDIFLKAGQIILEKIPHTHFLIIGDGPQKAYLMDLARTLGIEKNVHFLGFRRELADILAAVDVNTLSSKPEQETLSVAAIEAMSAGVPVVSTDVGFMKEIVIPGKTGYLVKVGDPYELASRIMDILQDDSLRTQMGKEAKKLVHEKLSVRQMTRAFENLFLEMVNQKCHCPK